MMTGVFYWLLVVFRIVLLVPLILLTAITSGAAMLSEELCDYLDRLTARLMEWGKHDKP